MFDMCKSCSREDIVVSTGLYQLVGGENAMGRIHGIAWGGDGVGG